MGQDGSNVLVVFERAQEFNQNSSFLAVTFKLKDWQSIGQKRLSSFSDKKCDQIAIEIEALRITKKSLNEFSTNWTLFMINQ